MSVRIIQLTCQLKLSITPFQAYRFRAILEKSYCAHILILHHDVKSPILPTVDNVVSIPTASPRDMQLRKNQKNCLFEINQSITILIIIFKISYLKQYTFIIEKSIQSSVVNSFPFIQYIYILYYCVYLSLLHSVYFYIVLLCIIILCHIFYHV